MRFSGILLAAVASLSVAALSAQQPAGDVSKETTAGSATAGPATPLPLPHTYPVSNSGALVVAPGLILPNGNLPWVLDDLGGRPALVPLHHATLTSAPGVPGTAILAGPRSSNILHRTTPTIFIHTSDRTENVHDQGRLLARPLWLLLPATPTGNARSVLRPAPDDGGHTRPEDTARPNGCTPSTICLAADLLPDGWLRLVPTAVLSPGEYVLMPAVRPPKAPADIVYDLTLDPAAPPDRDTVYAPGENPTRKKRR